VHPRFGLELRTLALGVAGVILVGSLLPMPPSSPPTGSVLGSVLSTNGSVGFLGVGVDKWVHGLSYAVLGGLVAAARGRRGGLELLVVVLAVAGLGVGIEVAQLAVPGRTGGSADALANLVGAVVGTVGWVLWSGPGFTRR
jgi:hypothetical protein